MKPLIAGNWKMNGLSASVNEVKRLISLFSGAMPDDREVLICPPFPIIGLFSAEFSDEGVAIGGQDCHPEPGGAHTGDVSAEMLADAGAAYVIVGHSERRLEHGETDDLVRRKAKATWRAGMKPIICVGETEAERRADKAKEIVGRQLAGSIPVGAEDFVIAYEPVWAIGTGLTPTLEDIADMHSFIRSNSPEGVRILYGGSVKPSNAADILATANVHGALVGGASLKAEDFYAIIQSLGK